jgi:hypothetical protein
VIAIDHSLQVAECGNATEQRRRPGHRLPRITAVEVVSNLTPVRGGNNS